MYPDLFESITLGVFFICFVLLVAVGSMRFDNPEPKRLLKTEEDLEGLIKETDVWKYIGVTEEDSKKLLEEYPDIPHITLNNNVYFHKSKLREWLPHMQTKQK